MKKEIHIVMPMAGLGSRTKTFSLDPKPFLEIHGLPLFKFALHGLPLERCRKITFVLNNKDRDFYEERGVHLMERFAPRGIARTVFFVDTTSGQAETVNLALQPEDGQSPLLIASCDTLVSQDFPSDYDTWDGLLGTFRSTDPGMSYVRLEKGRVVETAEKVVISDQASSGLYFFKRARDFQRVFRDHNFLGESYVAPLYNGLIGSGSKIGVWSHGHAIPLGTSLELSTFAAELGQKFLAEISSDIE